MGKQMLVLIGSVLCVLVMSGIFSTSYAQEFQNGSFEEGPADIGYDVRLDSGSTDLPGWDILSGSIDIKGDYWVASNGDRSLDLNGIEPGVISQTFDTEQGGLYQVLFDMAGNPDESGLKILLVTANSTVTEYEFDSTGKSTQTMGWIEMSFYFQANGPLTTLQFASTNPGAHGPTLDNVRVLPLKLFPEDIMPPTGAVHAHDNMLWPPNNKSVPVKIEGYVLDEMSMARDGEGIGVSNAYLIVNRKMIILRDDTTDLLNPDGSFSVVRNLKATKGAKYIIELWAADTTAIDDGGPNEDLVDSTFVRVPHDMSECKDEKKESKWEKWKECKPKKEAKQYTPKKNYKGFKWFSYY